MNEIKQVNALIADLGLTSVIPPLQSANFTIKSQQVSIDEIKNLTSEGWFLYSDKFTRESTESNPSNLLECQWYNKQIRQSGHVQLFGNDIYQLTTVQQFTDNQDSNEDAYTFQEISVFTKNQTQDKYQILWQCNDKGKYSVKAQAYLGCKTTTSQENT